jgi:hypothetical protein
VDRRGEAVSDALTVACVFVRGPYPYTAEYVVRLDRMVRRYFARPFRFVCLTDRGEELPAGIETIQIASLAGVVPPNGVGYWNKLRLFDPAIGLTGRVLYLDLDSLIVAPLDPIVDVPATLALTADALVVERAHLVTDRYGRRLVRRFNSSVMVWDGGTHQDLWTRWTPSVAQAVSTDQDWIGEQATDATGMPIDWFPRISQLRRDPMFDATGAPMPTSAIVVLTKKPKNHVVMAQTSWFDALWGGWAA